MPSPSIESVAADAWPSLPLDGWRDTYATLHLWTQVVGKLALALSPLTNHYWNTALQITPRGLATLPLTVDQRIVTVTFDFLSHHLAVECSDGRHTTVSLEPRPVAEFYRLVMEALAQLDVRARIWTMPVEVPNPIRFEADALHRSYDPAAARACWQILVQIRRVLDAFRGRFVGKTSPIHFWWGSFDLAHTRFSGRRAPVHPGGLPNLADAVIAPVSASYEMRMHEWILPYEAVRRAPDPDAALLEFAQSTYQAAADLGRWAHALLER